ncbi:MAG: hypothetical protein M1836_002658 [Candelina mexicana]|nr:MAG: hypothetical protein M1836_002658 [Candelina mexicana]
MCHAIRTHCTSCSTKYFTIETRCDGVINGIGGSVIGCSAPDPAWKTIEPGPVKLVPECPDCTKTGRDHWFVKDARPMGRTWEEIDRMWWGGEWDDPNTLDAEGYAVSKTRA